MSGHLLVRRAIPVDCDEVARVWHESASNMDGAPAEMATIQGLRERIDLELESGWSLFVAERNDQMVGMLAIKPHEATLDQIFVLTDEQHRGIGKILLDVSKGEMPHGFELRMAAENRRAERFYLGAGLRLVREGTHPGNDAPVKYFRWDGS